MKIAVVSCLHGNEGYGIEVGRRLQSIPFFIANENALRENKRFIDEDLNRCFPGKEDGNTEEQSAYNLLKKLKNFDYVIDLHSSSNECPLFGIVTKPNKEKIGLARKLGLKKLIIMPKFFASGKALIDHVKCGISLEIGPHEKKDNVNKVVKAIKNLIKNKENREISIYKVSNIIRKEFEGKILIKNFKKVKRGQLIAKEVERKQIAKFDFIPVFVNEEAYEGLLCLAAKRIA